MKPLGNDSAGRRAVLNRAPLVPVAGALAGGIALGRFAPLPTGFWGLLAAAALAAGWVTFFRPRLRAAATAALLAAILGLGAVYARLDYFTADADHVVTYTAENREIPSTLRGRIVTWPQIDEGSSQGVVGYRPPPKTTFLLEADAIHTSAGWQTARGLVRVTLRHPDRRVAAGQQVELVGMLGQPRRPDNPGGQDWAATARIQHILAEMTVPADDGAILLAGTDPSWHERLAWRLRAAARQHLDDCGGEEAGMLLNALVIGERDPALRSLNRSMVRGGVAHFLSISGQHLAVFLGFVFLLCRAASLAPRRAATVALIVLAIYLVMTVPSAPLLRSAIMAAAVCLAVILRRSPSTLNALAGSAAILLAIDPLQLFQAGFQLSFGTVTGLILLHRPIKHLLFGRWLRRRGLTVYREGQRLRRWVKYNLADFLMATVSVSLAASVASAPLVAYHFGLFSPYAAPLSILLLPLVTAVLVPAYVSLALAVALPNLSHAVAQIASAAADALAWAVRAIDLLPGAGIPLRPVGPWWVGLFYAATLLVLACRRIRFGRLLAAAAVVLLALATAYTQRTAATPKTAELNVLAVGNGQCTVLRAPGGATFVFDAGTRSGFDVFEQTLWPFLRDRRLPTPRVAFVSHANSDHYSGVMSLARKGVLRTVYLGERFAAADDAETPAREMLRLLEDAGTQVVRLHAGMRVDLDARTRVEVLWPPEGTNPALSENDASLVLRIVCDDRSVLLPGDVEAASQTALLHTGQDLRAEALMLPHHGAYASSLPDFVAAVSPQIVTASSAVQPGPSVLASREARAFYTHLAGAHRCYCTRRNGCIQLRFGRGRMEVETTR